MNSLKWNKNQAVTIHVQNGGNWAQKLHMYLFLKKIRWEKLWKDDGNYDSNQQL